MNTVVCDAGGTPGLLEPGSAAPDARRFDPSAPVSEEFDVFCEGCGYSLVGITADRCPECGRPYDPLALPYARIPWLHRRRIGRWKGFWRTVVLATFRPARFAAELCRPVRISRADARRFRGVATLIAATTVTASVMGALYFGTRPWGRADEIAFWCALPVAWGCAVLFFRLATDMPVFIWRGLPSLPPNELAPLHHYAAAPLAFAPAAAALAALPPWLMGLYDPPPWASHAPLALSAAVVIVWLVLCWRTPLALMRSATGCGRGRVVQLALYLPAHVLLMFVAAFLLFLAFLLPITQFVEFLERTF